MNNIKKNKKKIAEVGFSYFFKKDLVKEENVLKMFLLLCIKKFLPGTSLRKFGTSMVCISIGTKIREFSTPFGLNTVRLQIL